MANCSGFNSANNTAQNNADTAIEPVAAPGVCVHLVGVFKSAPIPVGNSSTSTVIVNPATGNVISSSNTIPSGRSFSTSTAVVEAFQNSASGSCDTARVNSTSCKFLCKFIIKSKCFYFST